MHVVMYVYYFIVLDLPSPNGSISVYVRTIYLKFYDIIMFERNDRMTLSKDLRKGLAVTGTPRIGKSMFLFYVAYRLCLDKVPFVVTIADKTYDSDFTEVDINEQLNNFQFIHLVDPDPLLGVTKITPAMPFFLLLRPLKTSKVTKIKTR